jgi:hypothetical protein
MRPTVPLGAPSPSLAFPSLQLAKTPRMSYNVSARKRRTIRISFLHGPGNATPAHPLLLLQPLSEGAGDGQACPEGLRRGEGENCSTVRLFGGSWDPSLTPPKTHRTVEQCNSWGTPMRAISNTKTLGVFQRTAGSHPKGPHHCDWALRTAHRSGWPRINARRSSY